MLTTAPIDERSREPAAGHASPLPSRPSPAADRAVQLAMLALGLALLALSWESPRFRDPSGDLLAISCLPGAAGVALLVLGVAYAGPFRAASGWFALLLVGQAVSLQLVVAGPVVGYQHLVRPAALVRDLHPFFSVFLAVQLSLVAVGMRRLAAPLLAGVVREFGAWGVAAVGAAVFLTSATLSRQPGVYVQELVLATALQLLSLATVVLLAAAVPAAALDRVDERLQRLLGGQPESGVPARSGTDRFAYLGAAWVTSIAALLSWLVYERHPHVPDEVVYLLHARYLAEGLLFLPLPSVPEAFDLDLMFADAQRWFSPVPVGWPAILALGAAAGAPWLVNPLLAGVSTLLAYLLLVELYDRRTARLAVLLLCVSPWHLFLGMSFMTHTAALAWALVAALGVARLRRTGHLGWACLGGIGIGMVGLIRPLEGFILAGLLGLWSLGLRWRGLRLVPVAVLALSTVATGSMTLPYNRLLTGRATQFPIMAYTDAHYGAGSNALGFGSNRGLGWTGLDPFPGHGPVDVLVNANLNLFALNVELFGWATGSLLLVALLLSSRRMCRTDLLMLAAAAGVVGIHSFYWFSGGPDFGPRYWFLILIPCVALSARGVQVVGEISARSAGGPVAGARAPLAVLALCAASLLAFVPWRALDKYRDYRGMQPGVRELASDPRLERDLVLVRGRRHPDYASAGVYNAVDPRDRAPVLAWDRSDEIRFRLLCAFPDRDVWLVDGPTRTGGGYSVARGPVPARQLLDEELASRDAALAACPAGR